MQFGPELHTPVTHRAAGVVILNGAGDILLSTDGVLVDERLYLDVHLVPGRYLPNGP